MIYQSYFQNYFPLTPVVKKKKGTKEIKNCSRCWFARTETPKLNILSLYDPVGHYKIGSRNYYLIKMNNNIYENIVLRELLMQPVREQKTIFFLYYLRHGGYVFIAVCPSVRLSVCRITENYWTDFHDILLKE